nr:unnamed protein product [Callosobruchus analis]
MSPFQSLTNLEINV